MLIQVNRNGVYANANSKMCKKHGNVEVELPENSEEFAGELVQLAHKFGLSKMYCTILLSSIGSENFPRSSRRDNGAENEEFKALLELLEKMNAKKKVIQILNSLEDKNPESALNMLQLIDANLFAKVSKQLETAQA